MIHQKDYQCDFNEYLKITNKKVIVYGAGESLESEAVNIQRIDYICDAGTKRTDYNGIKIIGPAELLDIKDEFCILFCIVRNNGIIYEEVCHNLDELGVEADIFNIYDNIAFDVYSRHSRKYMVKKENEIVHINLVCRYQAWVFKKFADRIKENINDPNVTVTISRNVDSNATLNHHIEFGGDIPMKGDTIMVSHVDCLDRLEVIKKQLETASLAICMSKETMDKLAVWGIPRNKLCYVNPAHDAVIKPRKYVLGVTHRCYDKNDLKKRGTILVDICKEINPETFRFEIMGDGWENVIEEMEMLGFEVNYQPFEYNAYTKLMPMLDYFLYYGFDEGSMGYMDALTAGVKTIVTPQGYHLDAKHGITYSCSTTQDFIDTLNEIEKERNILCRSVKDWTWDLYAQKHLEIWNYLLRRRGLSELYKNRHHYMDGIFSMCPDDLYQL